MHRAMFVLTAFLSIPFAARQTFGALISLEWSGEPGVASKSLHLGESATIDIRLDLVAGETFGTAFDFPLGIGSWWYPDSTPSFQIVGYADGGELWPGQGYQRWDLPSLPFAPTEYSLTVASGTPPVTGPATIYLDRLEIVALSVGHDDIVFGQTFQNTPEVLLIGADDAAWQYVDGYSQPGFEFWTFGIGHPGRRPTTPFGPGLEDMPLMLDVVPEPGTIVLLSVGIFGLHFGRQCRS